MSDKCIPSSTLKSVERVPALDYLGRYGAGPLFVGSVGAEWEHFSSAEREQSALKIVSNLGESGVREILVYDKSRRIALRFAEGPPPRIGF